MPFTVSTARANRARSLLLTAVATVCTVVTGGLFASVEAAFPGANGKIAFTSFRTGGSDIWVMDSDGSNATNLTPDAVRNEAPTWSSDGRRITFASNRTGAFDIWAMDADGLNATNITNDTFRDNDPTWSPDGQQIAYTSNRSASSGIAVIDADGTDNSVIADGPTDEFDPAWSPDGTRIAFARGVEGDTDIWSMAPDGSGQIQLTDDAELLTAPTWSPDGQRIGFVRGNLFTEAVIWVMDADGGNLTQLTEGIYAAQPAWSPDGQRIAFVGNSEGDNDIWTMDSSGTGAARLLAAEGLQLLPDWAPAIDSDGDGVPDNEDAFPDDPGESADSDGDGLGDNGDPDTVGDAVDALPDEAFRGNGHSNAIRARLDAAEAAIGAGDTDEARNLLEHLRTHLDGCESGGVADSNDWIVDCAAQNEIRALLDRLLESL